MVTSPILVFLDWMKRFHVHVNASSITLRVILAQPGEGVIDHPISFSIWKLFVVETNYMTTKQEGLVMVYALQKVYHYLLGGHFKMFIDHSTLKYLVNKPVLGGNICWWLLLFQDFYFKIIVKMGLLNTGPNNLLRIETGEEPSNIEDRLPDAELFKVGMFDDHYE